MSVRQKAIKLNRMCGRYLLSACEEAIEEYFGVETLPPLTARYNIAPSQDVLGIRLNPASGKREACLLRWGLVPYWVKDLKTSYKIINARAETVAEKPAFRHAFRHRRCLIPADGFYEWRTVDGRKQPYYIGLKNRALFAFAGLWEHWENSQGTVIESCTLLVTSPNPLVAAIHDRMPVILEPSHYQDWLNPSQDTAALQKLLVPYPAECMTTHPVSLAVNNPRNDSPALIEAAAH